MSTFRILNLIVRRTAVLCLGLAVMAFGVAVSIIADLGTSPISSLPYVTSLMSGLSVFFLHGLHGVREGTVAAALLVGVVAKKALRYWKLNL